MSRRETSSGREYLDCRDVQERYWGPPEPSRSALVIRPMTQAEIDAREHDYGRPLLYRPGKRWRR